MLFSDAGVPVPLTFAEVTILVEVAVFPEKKLNTSLYSPLKNSCVRLPDVPSPRVVTDPLATMLFAVTDKPPRGTVAPTFPVKVTVPLVIPPVVIVKVPLVVLSTVLLKVIFPPDVVNVGLAVMLQRLYKIEFLLK